MRAGPLAHLVERYYGIVEVTGSSPVRSTNKKSPHTWRFFVT
jgi:hypothetical protein